MGRRNRADGKNAVEEARERSAAAAATAAPPAKAERLCAADGCVRAHDGKRFCKAHRLMLPINLEDRLLRALRGGDAGLIRDAMDACRKHFGPAKNGARA